MKNPILDLPLTAVMRTEIAIPLQHVLKIYTVGGFLRAWRSPKNHRSIEQIFALSDGYLTSLLPEAGHWLQHEEPTTVSQALKEFFAARD